MTGKHLFGIDPEVTQGKSPAKGTEAVAERSVLLQLPENCGVNTFVHDIPPPLASFAAGRHFPAGAAEPAPGQHDHQQPGGIGARTV